MCRWSVTVGTAWEPPVVTPNGPTLCQDRNESKRWDVVFPHLWVQKADSAWKPGKIRRSERLLICSVSGALTHSCCSPLRYIFIHIKGPNPPIPSMQTQSNICSRVSDISLEYFPNGLIKTNSFALLATALPARALISGYPDLCSIDTKNEKINCLVIRNIILVFLFGPWNTLQYIRLCNYYTFLEKTNLPV